MSNLLPILTAKREQLRREITASAAAIDELTRDLAAERERHLRATAQLELVATLIVEESAIHLPKLKPSKAILRALKQRPGMTIAEVQLAVVGRITTTAKNEGHLIRSTLGNLHKLGNIQRINGRYSLPSDPDLPRFISWNWARADSGFDFQPAIVRQSPAVRMASRALPNPNGENQL